MSFFSDNLVLPASLLPFAASRQLSKHGFVLESEDGDFDFEAFVRAGHATMTPVPNEHFQSSVVWRGEKQPVREDIDCGWVEVAWMDQRLEVVKLAWTSGHSTTVRYFILAENADIAMRFFRAVCTFTTAVVVEQIVVYEEGCFVKSKELYDAIRSATFDGLILQTEMMSALRSDFSTFFESRDTFQRYGIPWKRGALFVGPPGNGKTHAIKALLNHVAKPCLYVKSLKAQCTTDHASIRAIFERAREMAPAFLVLEDLDTLVDEGNRSIFLNELDGFAENHGLVTLATTNYPEKLDPALVDRPSRFDRSYAFPLPDVARRAAFLARWNERLETELRVSDGAIDRIAEATAGFSFAYLKELGVAALLAWIRDRGSMDAIIETQARKLSSHVRRGDVSRVFARS